MLPARAYIPWNVTHEVLKRELEEGERCEICFCLTVPRKKANRNLSNCRKIVMIRKNDFTKCLTSLILHSHRDIFQRQDMNDHRFKNRDSFSICNVHYLNFSKKMENMVFKADNPYFDFIHPEISHDSLMETSSEARVVNTLFQVRLSALLIVIEFLVCAISRGGFFVRFPIQRKSSNPVENTSHEIILKSYKKKGFIIV